LTKQLLAFSRRQPLHAVVVDLNLLIGGLLKMLRRLLPESISIDLIAGHTLSSVSADRGQLEQVLVNLCVNARDAMEQGGRLTIETENVLINSSFVEFHPWAKPGRYVLLSITDTGTGMTPEVKERVFEPFFTTKPLHQGTGLGLATVYGIVQQHGGMIHLYSEPDQGTTFKVYLPADARAASEVEDKLQTVPPRGDETILIAEDEEQVRRAVVQLVQRAGYRAIAVATGAEAVRVLSETNEPVHLALLDVVMPDLGGPDTAERLRVLRPELRVLFASGYADKRYRARLPAGSVVLEKPFRTDELLRRIRDTLDRP
jgi:CheY-like chemotaxis protein